MSLRAYSTRDVAAAVRLSADTIRAAIRRGQLGAVWLGNQYRVPPSSLRAWLEGKPGLVVRAAADELREPQMRTLRDAVRAGLAWRSRN